MKTKGDSSPEERQRKRCCRRCCCWKNKNGKGKTQRRATISHHKTLPWKIGKGGQKKEKTEKQAGFLTHHKIRGWRVVFFFWWAERGRRYCFEHHPRSPPHRFSHLSPADESGEIAQVHGSHFHSSPLEFHSKLPRAENSTAAHQRHKHQHKHKGKRKSDAGGSRKIKKARKFCCCFPFSADIAAAALILPLAFIICQCLYWFLSNIITKQNIK